MPMPSPSLSLSQRPTAENGHAAALHQALAGGDLRVAASDGLLVGLDSVLVAEVDASLKQFGQRYVTRVFSPEEAAYALSAPACTAQRLAARFAAKEAVIKALNLCESGVGFQDITVRRKADGAPELQLHGPALASLIDWFGPAGGNVALSLCHDDHSGSAVVALLRHSHAMPAGMTTS